VVAIVLLAKIPAAGGFSPFGVGCISELRAVFSLTEFNESPQFHRNALYYRLAKHLVP
jgi:hypothetical protein